MVMTTHMQSAPQEKYQIHNVSQKKFHCQNFWKAPNVFTQLRKYQTQFYEILKARGLLYRIEGRPANPLGKF